MYILTSFANHRFSIHCRKMQQDLLVKMDAAIQRFACAHVIGLLLIHQTSPNLCKPFNPTIISDVLDQPEYCWGVRARCVMLCMCIDSPVSVVKTERGVMSHGRASPTLPSLNNAAQHDLSADNGRAAFVLSTPFLPRTIPSHCLQTTNSQPTKLCWKPIYVLL